MAISLCSRRSPSQGVTPGLRPGSVEWLCPHFPELSPPRAGCVLHPCTLGLQMRRACFIGSNCLENVRGGWEGDAGWDSIRGWWRAEEGWGVHAAETAWFLVLTTPGSTSGICFEGNALICCKRNGLTCKINYHSTRHWDWAGKLADLAV